MVYQFSTFTLGSPRLLWLTISRHAFHLRIDALGHEPPVVPCVALPAAFGVCVPFQHVEQTAFEHPVTRLDDPQIAAADRLGDLRSAVPEQIDTAQKRLLGWALW